MENEEDISSVILNQTEPSYLQGENLGSNSSLLLSKMNAIEFKNSVNNTIENPQRSFKESDAENQAIHSINHFADRIIIADSPKTSLNKVTHFFFFFFYNLSFYSSYYTKKT
jgi:hypothetical protein